jgi:hypothetical protein
MRLINALIIAITLFASSGCYAREQNRIAASPGVSIEQADSDTYTLQSKLRSGKRFNHARFSKRTISNHWVLELRPALNMQVRDVQSLGSSSPMLTTDEFLELMGLLLKELGKNGMKPDEVHVDLGLVDGYELLVETSIRQAMCKGGVVKTADPCWSQALRDRLESSDITKRACVVMSSQNVKCAKRVIDMNPVVLPASLHGKQRDFVAAQRHAGVRISVMWFALAIE